MNWITFVGEGRSGHTVLSGILCSHPRAIVTEEQKYISKWLRGFSRDDIFKALYASEGGGNTRKQMGFPNLDKHTDPLLAVGDKCGWDAVNEVKKRGESADILTRFSKFIGMPVKVIHSSRHPLDNITAWLASPKYQRMFGNEELLHKRMIRRYCRFYEAAELVMEGQDVFHLRNEELIAHPTITIRALSEWLGLPVDERWLETSAGFVNPKPNRRRDQYPWIEEYREQVLTWRVIDRFPSLAYYKES
jgi:hypothetical protein